MESNFLTTIFLPLALFTVMLGMGLGFTIADFKRIAIAPRAVIIGLLAQLVMLPLVVNFATRSFIRENVSLQLPFGETVVQIAVIVLIPVALEMALHRYAPQFSAKVEKWVKRVSLFFLALIIFGLLLKERANVLSFFL